MVIRTVCAYTTALHLACDGDGPNSRTEGRHTGSVNLQPKEPWTLHAAHGPTRNQRLLVHTNNDMLFDPPAYTLPSRPPSLA